MAKRAKSVYYQCLRVTASILLMGILLFNGFGYQMLYHYLESRQDQKLEALIDKNHYDKSELVTIKIPLFTPYISDQAEFQRIDGEVNYNGILYKYVKRRVYHDSLILLCIADHEKMKLKEVNDRFFKCLGDIQKPGSNKSKEGNHSNFKNLFSEFNVKQYSWSLSASQVNSRRFPRTNQSLHPLLLTDNTEHPPENLHCS